MAWEETKSKPKSKLAHIRSRCSISRQTGPGRGQGYIEISDGGGAHRTIEGDQTRKLDTGTASSTSLRR